MPALNFKKQFAAAVQSGKKRQTIRQPRKDGRPHAKVGDQITLYTGMRTKGCRKLGVATCTDVQSVKIGEAEFGTSFLDIDGQRLSINERCQFAQDDGFGPNPASALFGFNRFFRDHYGFPFEGVLIKWSAISSHAPETPPDDVKRDDPQKTAPDGSMP